MHFRSIVGASIVLATTTAHTLQLRDEQAYSSSLLPRTASDASSEWPYGPFSTRGRDIVNAKGEAVTWAGVNWPGSGETMIPEGLEWESVEDIVARISSVGFNFVRLTYAIEMVNQITKVTQEIISKNPQWTKDTTRFEIWDHIANVARNQSIYIHPDVHVGKAQWCCNNTDGNAWFNDYNFPVDHWKRGLQYVANWAKDHPNVVSMSLRNELRRAINTTAPTSTIGYNWLNLVGNNTAATDAIHQVNPDILITWSGLQYDEDLSALTTGLNLNTAPCYKCDAIRDGYRREPIIFDLEAHPWADKVVYELHLYSMSEDLDTDDCSIIQAQFYRNGFNALGIDPPAACNITGDCPQAIRRTPVMISEFGSAQDATLFNSTLQGCLREFTVENNISWAMWCIAGSYRIRSGGQGVGDTWALTNYEWDGWNFPQGIERWWKPWVEAMFA